MLDKLKVYGTRDLILTFTVVGFQGIDTEADLDIGVTIARISGEDAGSYTIALLGASDTNYNISFVPAEFTVSRAYLIITGFLGDDKEYDGTTVAKASGTALLSELKIGDDVVLEGSPIFTFESVELGTDIVINSLGFAISGADLENYLPIQPVLSAGIFTALGVGDIL
jgi:hypothetical protein